jgi:hypothetical protein
LPNVWAKNESLGAATRQQHVNGPKKQNEFGTNDDDRDGAGRDRRCGRKPGSGMLRLTDASPGEFL